MPLEVCIHGHFYQPPRENPWLESVEVQDGAYPYHDWNERITAECYAPNARSRILDAEERIVAIVNNYARMSFDFGPTLLSWLEAHAPEVYASVLDADRESAERFSGHGSALAHVYNHVILPLANARDRATQVLWGIADFRRRFGREPEGFWLPETAVDLASLDLLAEHGIAFTVLAPHQALRYRDAGQNEWQNVAEQGIDPTQPCRLSLPSGRSIAIFFYDNAISREIAFGGLLHSGRNLAERLLARATSSDGRDGLVHVATDGETYGHHHAHGDMALAFALGEIASHGVVRLTNYGEFLEKHPPSREVEIRENTSWSCAHGVERWQSDCGCASGSHPGWRQAWRQPLRWALDNLRDSVAPAFEEQARRFLRDPWAARDAYIGVVLDRSAENIAQFLGHHAAGPLEHADQTTVFKLLELQRHAMLMYTSCGWFFDDVSGIEAVQVLRYAGRVVQLAEDLFGGSFETPFLGALERAPSNLPEVGSGRTVYEREVRPSRIDLASVGGHYAVRSLFEPYALDDRIYCYRVEGQDFRLSSLGPMKLVLGRGRFTSDVTKEARDLAFGALHLGDHNVDGGVREASTDVDYQHLVGEIEAAFARGDAAEVLRRLNTGFGENVVSLKTLFRDEQRRIVRIILESTRTEAEEMMRQMHERHLPLSRFLADLDSPLPRVLRASAEFVIHLSLRRAFESEALDPARIAELLEEARQKKVPLDAETLEYLFRQRIQAPARRFGESPADADRLKRLREWVTVARSLPFPVRLWEVQNVFWTALQEIEPQMRARGQEGDTSAQRWRQDFVSLGELLRVRVP
jgi:alpha-amylase/alpha-mannosidase (GH57 family)